MKKIFPQIALSLLSLCAFSSHALEVDAQFIQAQKKDVKKLIKQQIELNTRCKRKELVADMQKHIDLAVFTPKKHSWQYSKDSSKVDMLKQNLNKVQDAEKKQLKEICQANLRNLDILSPFKIEKHPGYGYAYAISSKTLASIKVYYHETSESWSMNQSIYSKKMMYQ